jgi:hypothetical protein
MKNILKIIIPICIGLFSCDSDYQKRLDEENKAEIEQIRQDSLQYVKYWECNYSPYVKGKVLKKQYISGYFENQTPVIVEASIFGIITPTHTSSSHTSSVSSSHSYSSSRSVSTMSYKSISTSRPTTVKPFSSKIASEMHNNDVLIYPSKSGKYYTPIVGFNVYHNYENYYKLKGGNLILSYILIFHNLNQSSNETPLKYYLPEYKLNILDSAQNNFWVNVDSMTYYKYHKNDFVNFKRFQIVDYEDESQVEEDINE